MKVRSTGKNYISGFITLEILIAFAVVILSIGAVVMIAFGNQSVSVDGEINNEAIFKAQSLLEKTRADSRSDFNLVNPILPHPDPNNFYTESLDVVQKDLFTKKVTSTISWQSAGRSLFTTFTTLLTNRNSTNTCSSVLPNALGWKNPAHYEFPFISGTSIADLDIFNNKLYIVASNTQNKTDQSFFVLQPDNDSSRNPTMLGGVDNNIKSVAGLNSLKVFGNYAYVANAYGADFTNCTQAGNCSQFQIIDISNPASPVVVKSVKVPGVTGKGGKAIGMSIFYKKGYVYLGLSKTESGPEFNVFDVGGGGFGSPTSPVWKGGYRVSNAVNDIFVEGNYAYLATPNSNNLIILDISKSDNPIFVSGYTPPNGLNGGEHIYVVGNTVYLGRTFGADEFQILNVSNPKEVSLIAKMDIGTSNKTTVHGLLIRDYLAFIFTLDQFQVWNISNPNNIEPWTSDGTKNTFLSALSLGGNGIAIDCEGDRIYAALSQSSGPDNLTAIVPGS